MPCVYRHVRLDTNKVFYIGIGKTQVRANYFLNRNSDWHAIANNCSIRVDILFEDVSYDFAKQKEREFILLYGRQDLHTGTLVNKNSGGQGGSVVNRKLTDDFKHYLRSTIKEKFFNPETIKKRTATQKGRPASKSRVEKLKATLKANPRRLTKEVKDKIAASHVGKKLSLKHKVAQCHYRFKGATRGTALEVKRPFTHPSSYVIYQVDPFTDEVLNTFDRSAEAARFFHISDKGISQSIRKGGLCNGYKWLKKPKYGN